MDYRFKCSDVSVEAAVTRIASGEARLAIAEIDSASISRNKVVHQVRKRCKKLRALLRLVGPHFDRHRIENSHLREASAALSSPRDAAVMLSTYDSLRRFAGVSPQNSGPDAIRAKLIDHQREAASDDRLAGRLAAFRKAMVEFDRRIPDWKLKTDGFAAISSGLKKTHHRARRMMAQCSGECTSEDLHEWRKRVKDHWYHSRLLHSIRPSVMEPHRDAALALSELLGEHQDLAVLKAWMLDDPTRFDDPEALHGLIAIIEGQRKGSGSQSLGMWARDVQATVRQALQRMAQLLEGMERRCCRGQACSLVNVEWHRNWR